MSVKYSGRIYWDSNGKKYIKNADIFFASIMAEKISGAKGEYIERIRSVAKPTIYGDIWIENFIEASDAYPTKEGTVQIDLHNKTTYLLTNCDCTLFERSKYDKRRISFEMWGNIKEL